MLKKSHLSSTVMWCKVFGLPYLAELMRRPGLKILLTSLTINDKDRTTERRAKTGDMYSGKVFVSSALLSLKHN